MDNAIYVGLTRQIGLRRALDVVANNMANLSTAGFKTDALLFETEPGRPAVSQIAPRDIKFVDGWAMARDMSTGPLERTGGELDVALGGPGFFTVQGPDGPLYTRAGRFALSPTGEIVTVNGQTVLSDAGAPLVVNPTGGPLSIAGDGTVSQGEAAIGRLGVAEFANPQALEKVGDNLFSPAGQAPTPATAARVAQGMVEGSNVKPVFELTRLIEIQRAYESVSRMIRSEEELRNKAIERLGRPQS